MQLIINYLGNEKVGRKVGSLDQQLSDLFERNKKMSNRYLSIWAQQENGEPVQTNITKTLKIRNN